MTRLILTFFLYFLYSTSFGQTNENIISNIKTVSQAESFIQKNPKANANTFEIKSGDDTNEILLPIFKKRVGFTFRINDIMYKILKIDSTLYFRVNYIYLNGQKFSKNQIDSLREEIILKYKTGISFFELVQQYNMDGSQTGDTNWFTEGMMVKGFEDAVRSHKKNDIFTVDTPEQNWFHVVLKTFDDTFIKKMTIFSLK